MRICNLGKNLRNKVYQGFVSSIPVSTFGQYGKIDILSEDGREPLSGHPNSYGEIDYVGHEVRVPADDDGKLIINIFPRKSADGTYIREIVDENEIANSITRLVHTEGFVTPN